MVSESNKDLVFIVSGGRTGTQFLGDKLSAAIDQSFSEHEPDLIDFRDPRALARVRNFGLWKAVVGKLVGQTGIRTIGTLLLKNKISRTTALERLSSARRSYHAKIRHPLIIESNYQWHLACNEIFDIWPAAKIAVIIRDPRSWIRSWMNKGTRWTLMDITRWLPPGRPTPASTHDDTWISEWENFDTFARLAWEWRFIYSRLDNLVRLNTNAEVFRFEDLFGADNDTFMKELIHFCARHRNKKYSFIYPEGFLSEKVNESGGSLEGWEAWSGDRCRLVDSLCGPLMQKYGYGSERTWLDRISNEGSS